MKQALGSSLASEWCLKSSSGIKDCKIEAVYNKEIKLRHYQIEIRGWKADVPFIAGKQSLQD